MLKLCLVFKAFNCFISCLQKVQHDKQTKERYVKVGGRYNPNESQDKSEESLDDEDNIENKKKYLYLQP